MLEHFFKSHILTLASRFTPSSSSSFWRWCTTMYQGLYSVHIQMMHSRNDGVFPPFFITAGALFYWSEFKFDIKVDSIWNLREKEEEGIVCHIICANPTSRGSCWPQPSAPSLGLYVLNTGEEAKLFLFLYICALVSFIRRRWSIICIECYFLLLLLL